MRLLPSAFALTLTLAASACAPISAPGMAAAPPPPPAGPCNADAARWAIGRAVDQELINRVIHDTGSRTARVIEPGQAVTMDFNPERVSIDVNERGAIVGIRCG